MFRVLAIIIFMLVATLWTWHAFAIGDVEFMSDCPLRLFRRTVSFLEIDLGIYRPLKEAFSSGVLHSKIYNA